MREFCRLSGHLLVGIGLVNLIMSFFDTAHGLPNGIPTPPIIEAQNVFFGIENKPFVSGFAMRGLFALELAIFLYVLAGPKPKRTRNAVSA